MAQIDENQRYATQVEAILAGRMTEAPTFYVLKHSETEYSLARIVEDLPGRILQHQHQHQNQRPRPRVHAVCEKEADGSYTVRSWQALHPEDAKPEFRLPLLMYLPLKPEDDDNFED